MKPFRLTLLGILALFIFQSCGQSESKDPVKKAVSSHLKEQMDEEKKYEALSYTIDTVFQKMKDHPRYQYLNDTIIKLEGDSVGMAIRLKMAEASKKEEVQNELNKISNELSSLRSDFSGFKQSYEPPVLRYKVKHKYKENDKTITARFKVDSSLKVRQL